MRLLVSVSNPVEALAAIEGGADIIDAKDPQRGPLGPVTAEMLIRISDACRGRAPLTAALGDAPLEPDVAAGAARFASAGAGLVKLGFAGMQSESAIESALREAVRGVRGEGSKAGVIAVAYADADGLNAPVSDVVLTVAMRAGVAGVLIDTADKGGPGLRALMATDQLKPWVERAHDAGLLVAAAGRLEADDFVWVASLGVDIVGVRGAACEAGRSSAVSEAKVSMLRARCAAASQPQPCSTARPAAAPA
ncbi:MAG: (5-formylfuran-3-yl)methyl phosphate synthase [Vicinamibacterales bacterium]